MKPPGILQKGCEVVPSSGASLSPLSSRGRTRQARWAATLFVHPVPVAIAAAGVLHLLWWWLVANSGGDLAAQDAWAEFARAHPGSAYNFSWYGGVHPASYSLLSPYLMAALGVRTTVMLAGTISAGLLALLLVRSNALRRPLWPALYGALALTGNAVSGRVTFGLGIMFALGALTVIFAWPERWRSAQARHAWPRAVLTATLSALATASSPVAGLFVGVVAGALWLQRRRLTAVALGFPPVVVVAVSAWLFPFTGLQPMGLSSALLPVALGVCGFMLAPKQWRTVRLTSIIYVVGVMAVWAIPSQIGTNVTRLSLLFGGVLLVAVATRNPARRLVRGSPPNLHSLAPITLALAIVVSSIWQAGTAVRDLVHTRPTEAWSLDLDPLVHQLDARNANRARVEVVPARSHREASALAPYVNLARGWNRQADAERNPIFYGDGLLTPESYHAWLDQWAVGFVVLPTGQPDQAALGESELVAGGLDYLHEVWSDASWRLYEVTSPTPLADLPAIVKRFDAEGLVLAVPTAGEILVRILDSPWLSLVDAEGQALAAPTSDSPDTPPVNVYGCLSEQTQPTTGDEPDVTWIVLHAPVPGTYRIAAPYNLPRGTACPEELLK